MAKIRRDDKNLPVENKSERGDRIIAALAGSTLPNVAGPLAEFTTANGKLRTDHNAAVTSREDAQDKTGIETASDIAWNQTEEVLLVAVEHDTKGNPDLIPAVFATYEPGRPAGGASPAQAGEKPTQMNASVGDHPGETDLDCNGRKGVRGYVWQICTGDPSVEANWRYCGQSSGSKYTAKGAVSGSLNWFRVAMMLTGSDNQTPWSDPAESRAA